MLRNKTENSIEVKYNGIDKVVGPGEMLDVRDFDISGGQLTPLVKLIPSVEKRFLRKHPGIFEHTEDTTTGANHKELIKQVKDLESANQQLRADNDSLKKTGEANAQKITDLSEEVNAFGTKEADYKEKISALKKQLKDQEEEHKAHVARLTGGKNK